MWAGECVQGSFDCCKAPPVVLIRQQLDVRLIPVSRVWLKKRVTL
jgi:hypothetical protein